MNLQRFNGSGESRWYAVQARPHSEGVALRHLANQKFVTFCPRSRIVRKIGRHHVDSIAPFFRGYFFVQLDLDRQAWRAINGTIGIVKLVSFGKEARPTPLPEGFLEALAALAGPDGEIAFDERFNPGDCVRVAKGPFADLCGVLQSTAGEDRVTVLLNILSRETRVELRRSDVVAA